MRSKLFQTILMMCIFAHITYGMNWIQFTWCAGSDLLKCPGSELKKQYDLMSKANCMNCDKYFHCQGNYNAVYKCGGDRKTNAAIAKKISDCREKAQPGNAADSAQDQVANAYGRNGGNCAAKYLCSYNCKYSPSRNTCSKSNCK